MHPLKTNSASGAKSTDRSRPIGQTSATVERPPQWMAGTRLQFNLEHELAQLRAEDRWSQSGHNAKALVKETSLRVVLVAMKSGATLAAHRAPAPITIQTLRGHLQVHLTDTTVDLPVGGLLALDGNIEHDVKAPEESAFLLTLTWMDTASAAEATIGHPIEALPRILDVREIPPRERHELIFATYEALGPGEAFELVNDHDPKPLYYQFSAEHTGQFTWTYQEQGPEVWRVQIGKTDQ